MAIFNEIRLSWDGREFVIPAERVMGAIAEVEEVATFPDLVIMTRGGRPNVSKVARAYAALLRYAGAALSDEEVYAGMFRAGETHTQVLTALNALVMLMMPPTAIAEATSEGNLRGAKAAPSSSSKPSSKRRSAAAG